MVTPQRNLIRVSLTLDPIDVDLLDRLGKIEGRTRSAEVRGILEEFRPMLTATVEAFEAAVSQRMKLDDAMASAAISQLEAVMPEVEKIQQVYLGALSRIEGAAAAQAALDPRPSNHGGHNSPGNTPN